jgi:hypothetical protein
VDNVLRIFDSFCIAPRQSFLFSVYLAIYPPYRIFIQSKLHTSFIPAGFIFKMSNFSVPNYLCTVDICPISQAQIHYIPSLLGNTLNVTIFSLLILIQIIQGIYYRTWTFTLAMIGGLTLEVIGYASRIQMHFNPFLFSSFLMCVL